ncbi:MAG TPA: V-type ATP synthase subunit E [Candidatus Methanoperedens sp.]
MGLDAIVEEIKAKGRAEAEKISGETYQEVSKILASAESQAAKIKAAKKEAVQKEIERLRQQELSSAHLEAKRAMLNARKELLDEVNENARDAIKKIPDDKNQELLKSIIGRNENNNARIYSTKKDMAAIKKITKLEYAGNVDCIGGVTIENRDGSEYLDFRYDTILKNVSEQSLKQVSDILFG